MAAGSPAVLPRSRAEDGAFRQWCQTHTPDWTEADRHPGPRLGEPDTVYATCPAPTPSAEGYRIIWVHSTAKAARDAAARQTHIEAGLAAIEALADKLAGPRCRLRSKVAVHEAATAALTDAHAGRWVTFTVAERTCSKPSRTPRPSCSRIRPEPRRCSAPSSSRSYSAP